MKTIYNKIFAALAFAALLCPTACVEEAPEYTKADAVGNAEVYFPTDLETSYNLKDYDGTLSIDVKRVDATEQLTVPITVSADAIFTVPSSVTFSAGSTDAKISFAYDLSKVEEEKEYPVSITLGDQTTPYGLSSYEFTVSIPASYVPWKGDDGSKTGKVHFTEEFWGEEHTVSISYSEVDGIRYCKISGSETCSADGCEGGLWGNGADFEFTWDTKTNKIDVPKQPMWYHTSYSAYVYVYSWYEYFITDGGKAGAWNDAADFYERNGETYPQSYYDGNGGFYFNLLYYIPGLGGWNSYQFDVVGIADGFVRTVDYNDDDHVGSSSPLYDGDAASQFFSADTTFTPENFEAQMRYDGAYLSKVDSTGIPEAGTTTTYYLKDYFGEGYGLAFTAPAPELLADGAEISNVENDQETGVVVFGNPVYVSVKSGAFTFEEDSEFPTTSITLKVYTKNADGEMVFDFGQVTETFTASSYAKDNYTIEDIYGGYLEDYLGTWTIASYDYFNKTDYAYEITLSDAGQDTAGNQLVKISNITGYAKYFDDSIYAYYGEDGVLYVYAQALEGTYQGYSINMYTMESDNWSYYEAYPVLGGICKDGNLAFVSMYSNVNLNGFGFYAPGYGWIAIVSNIRGLMEESSSVSRHIMLEPQKDNLQPFGSLTSSVKKAKVGRGDRVVLTKKSESCSKVFSLSPVESHKAYIETAPAQFNGKVF